MYFSTAQEFLVGQFSDLCPSRDNFLLLLECVLVKSNLYNRIYAIEMNQICLERVPFY